MENAINERQSKAKIWIENLWHYAEEKNMPMRILDEVEECRERLSSVEIDWDAMDTTVGELLESIEEKEYPVTTKKEQFKQEISAADVEAQVKKMAQRCHADNITSLESMEEQKNIVIKKNCEQIMEISYTKAHLEELKNEDLYLQFFQNRKMVYEKDVSEMIRDMLQSISGNYNHMLNHMRSMFQSIGGYKNGMGNEKFYQEYEERRTGIDAKVRGEAESADIGGEDIISFGQKTGQTIKNIVNKLVWKRKILAWLPLIILLCIFAGNAIIKQEQSKAVVESSANADEDNAEIREEVLKIGVKVLEKVTSKLIKSVINFVLSLLLSIGAVLIFIILLVIVIYVFYLKALKAWCDQQICKSCGEFLKTELSQFTQNNIFSSKLDAVMENAVNVYEQQYMIVLSNLFQDSPYGSDHEQESNRSKISLLRDEWKKIMYE